MKEAELDFTVNKNKETQAKEKIVRAYGLKAVEVAPDSDEALCQSEEFVYPKGDSKFFFFVKKCTADGGLLNPRALFGNKNKNKQNGIDTFKFITVKKEVFDNYLSYLETGNNVFFNRAERVVLHESQ